MKFALKAYPALLTSLRRITAVGGGLTLLATSLASCGSEEPSAAPPPAEGTLLITDANSFQSTASLNIGTLNTPATGADVSVCWNAPEDLLCHAVSDNPVKTVFLLRISEPNQDEVRRLLVAGQLDDYVDRTLRYTGADVDPDKCATLAEFKAGEDVVDINAEFFASPAHSYLLVFSSETATGQGTLSLSFLSPGAGADPVLSPTGCGQLSYSVELETLAPVAVPMAGPWVVDWRDLTRTGDGQAVPFADIDRALLAFYEGKDLKYLEENIFDLEQIEGAKYWEIPLTGERNTDLSLAKDLAGTPFLGFQTATAGTWALALMCDTCSSPAPIMLTVLSPTG